MYMRDTREADEAIRDLDRREWGYRRPRPLKVQWAKVRTWLCVWWGEWGWVTYSTPRVELPPSRVEPRGRSRSSRQGAGGQRGCGAFNICPVTPCSQPAANCLLAVTAVVAGALSIYSLARLTQLSQKAEEPKQNQPPSKTLFVVNFDVMRTSVRDIEDHFYGYGKLRRVDIKRNYAFVEYHE